LISGMPKYHDGGLVDSYGTGLKSNPSMTIKDNPNSLTKKHPSVTESGEGGTVNNHFAINLSAIDSKSGVEFLAENSKIIEGLVGRAVTKNRKIRRDIGTAY